MQLKLITLLHRNKIILQLSFNVSNLWRHSKNIVVFHKIIVKNYNPPLSLITKITLNHVQ